MTKNVYLAGSMTGLTDEEMDVWRHDMQSKIESVTAGDWKCFNPVDHFSPNSLYAKHLYGDDLDRIAMEIDLDKLRNSRVVICDMEHQKSIGTSCELGIAHELKIPIIGVCSKENRETLHPWWKLFPMVIVDDYEDAFLFFVEHFANND